MRLFSIQTPPPLPSKPTSPSDHSHPCNLLTHRVLFEDARAVLDVAEREGVSELTHVLCTHNHWDHAGGNADMVALRQGIIVVGGRGDGVQAVTKEVSAWKA